MKKTNIRINNIFLIEKNNQYFLSDVSNQDQWINTNNLASHKGKNITSKYQELSEKYGVDYNVNFITNLSGGGWGMGKVVQSGGWGMKNIKQSGGWGMKNIKQSGGWGMKNIKQSGGWGMGGKKN